MSDGEMKEKTKAQTAAEHMMAIMSNPLISINDWDCQFLTVPVEGYVDDLGGCRAMTGEVIFKVYLTNSEIKKRFEEILLAGLAVCQGAEIKE